MHTQAFLLELGQAGRQSRDMYLEHISDEAVSDDGDKALPQRRAVQVVAGLEVGAQEREAHQRIDIYENKSEHCHPQQRHTCNKRSSSCRHVQHRLH